MTTYPNLWRIPRPQDTAGDATQRGVMIADLTAAELLVCISIISVAHPGHAILRRLRDLYDQLPREGSDRG